MILYFFRRKNFGIKPGILFFQQNFEIELETFFLLFTYRKSQKFENTDKIQNIFWNHAFREKSWNFVSDSDFSSIMDLGVKDFEIKLKFQNIFSYYALIE